MYGLEDLHSSNFTTPQIVIRIISIAYRVNYTFLRHQSVYFNLICPLFYSKEPLTKLSEHLQTLTSAVVGSNLINVRSQIRVYGWEKIWKSINIWGTFIWHSRVFFQNFLKNYCYRNISTFYLTTFLLIAGFMLTI